MNIITVEVSFQLRTVSNYHTEGAGTSKVRGTQEKYI